jgi:hypothetical protein
MEFHGLKPCEGEDVQLHLGRRRVVSFALDRFNST